MIPIMQMVLRPTKRRMNPGFAYLFAYSSSFVAEIKEERRGLLVEFASLFEHSREEKKLRSFSTHAS